MEDDKTVLMRSKPAAAQSDPDRTLLVGGNRLAASLVDAAGRSVAGYSFTGDFRVGRSADNDIVIQDRRSVATIAKLNSATGVGGCTI
ncbi:hypothetical protein [Methylomonas koyamae]|uniref:hypothetical protein n=1 Tax=Methylomonas koyamae TaxID=702114 RepID=UPI0006D1594D|nr:hypothetical protein [Methylomonas koyamae]